MQGNPGWLNLDRLAAQHAQAIVGQARNEQEAASDLDNTVTKALGVLQENGLYAFCLFLLARPKKEQKRAQIVIRQALALLAELRPQWEQPASTQPSDVLPYISNTVSAELMPSILAKETLEQMLVYARYGAKAWKQSSPPTATHQQNATTP